MADESPSTKDLLFLITGLAKIKEAPASAQILPGSGPTPATTLEDNIRTVQNFRKMTPEQIADVRKRAVVGSGVYTGPTMEYWKKKA